MPLTRSSIAAPDCASPGVELARRDAAELFPNGRSPAGALGGLLLFLGCWDAAHEVVQDLETSEGAYWHGIIHRQEPDPGNAAYWFRRVGDHPIFPVLCQEAHDLLSHYPNAAWRPGRTWDPFRFISFCEEGSDAAAAIQHAEWVRLFEYCALPDGGR